MAESNITCQHDDSESSTLISYKYPSALTQPVFRLRLPRRHNMRTVRGVAERRTTRKNLQASEWKATIVHTVAIDKPRLVFTL